VPSIPTDNIPNRCCKARSEDRQMIHLAFLFDKISQAVPVRRVRLNISTYQIDSPCKAMTKTVERESRSGKITDGGENLTGVV